MSKKPQYDPEEIRFPDQHIVESPLVPEMEQSFTMQRSFWTVKLEKEQKWNWCFEYTGSILRKRKIILKHEFR